MLEAEERRITVFVEGFFDCVGPDRGVRECFFRPQDLADFRHRARALQMELGDPADDPVARIPEGPHTWIDCQNTCDEKGDGGRPMGQRGHARGRYLYGCLHAKL